MKLKVFQADGTGPVEKDFAIPTFEGDKGRQVLKQAIVAIQANQRRGTVSTKTRRTVHGTGKKPFRQKGTGRARQGTMVAPQHYHGSVAMGPQPRDWSQKTNKRERTLALSRALFERAQDGEVLLIAAWQLPERRTRLFNEVVSKIAPAGSTLVVDVEWADDVVLAARNLERVTIQTADHLNVVDLCRYDFLVLSEAALLRFLERLDTKKKEAA